MEIISIKIFFFSKKLEWTIGKTFIIVTGDMDRTDPSKYIVINKNIQQFLKNSKFKEAFTEIIFYDLYFIFLIKKLAILAFCDFFLSMTSISRSNNSWKLFKFHT